MITILEPAGIGLAAEDKKPLEWQLEVYSPEKMPMMQGGLEAGVAKTSLKGNGGDGEYTVDMDMSNSISARWLPFSSYIITPPDMAKGMKVELWRIKDTEKYFWRDIGLEKGLKRQETVILGIRAAPADSDVNEFDPATSYYLEVSSHGKHITLHTSTALGEPTAFTMQFNTGEGRFVLEDDLGDELLLDAVERLISAKNSDGTFFKLEKQEVTGKALKVTFDAPEVVCTQKLTCEILETNSVQGKGGGKASGKFGHIDADSIQTKSINSDSHSH